MATVDELLQDITGGSTPPPMTNTPGPDANAGTPSLTQPVGASNADTTLPAVPPTPGGMTPDPNIAATISNTLGANAPAPTLPTVTPPSAPAPSARPGSTLGDEMRAVLPFLVAGIAARKGGPLASAAALSGASNAIAQQKQLEQTQMEQRAKLALTQEQRDREYQQFQQKSKDDQANFIRNATEELKNADPMDRPWLAQLLDKTAVGVYGMPTGTIQVPTGLGPSKAQRDAASAQIKDLEANFGPTSATPFWTIDDNSPITSRYDGKQTTLGALKATAGLDVSGPGGTPLHGGPDQASTFVTGTTPLDNLQRAAIRTAVQKKGAPLTPEEINATIAAVPEPGKPNFPSYITKMGLTGNSGPEVQARNAINTLAQSIAQKEGAPRDPTPAEMQPIIDKYLTPAAMVKIEQTNAANAAAAGAPPQTFDASPPDPTKANVVDPVTGQTGNDLYYAAIHYATTGQRPPLMAGMGNSPKGVQMRSFQQAVLSKASALVANSGTTFGELQSEYKGLQGAERDRVNKFAATAAAARTADDNMQLALGQDQQLAQAGQLSNVPLANRFQQWITSQAGGTQLPNLSKLEVYIYTVAREYGKVVGGSASSAQPLTDAQNKAADRLLNAAQTPATFASVLDGMRNDMRTQTSEQLGMIDDINKTIGGFLQGTTGVVPISKSPLAGTTSGRGAGGAGGQTPPPTATDTKTTGGGLTFVKYSNGQWSPDGGKTFYLPSADGKQMTPVK